MNDLNTVRVKTLHFIQCYGYSSLLTQKTIGKSSAVSEEWYNGHLSAWHWLANSSCLFQFAFTYADPFQGQS